MKILVIGGLVPERSGSGASYSELFVRTMRELGAALAHSRLELIICSLFEGAADIEVLRGFASVFGGNDGAFSGSIEVHHPDDAAIGARTSQVLTSLHLRDTQVFRHPPTRDSSGAIDRTYSWLLAQLAALDRCHAVIAAGGDVRGSSNMLLQLAETRLVPILPLGFLGGAGEAALDRHRYELMDRLGDCFSDLQRSEAIASVPALVERVAERGTASASGGSVPRFFISYPRRRPEEADFVEMTLRRRNCEVFRDDHSFDAGGDLPSLIRDNIYRANVFIALWCEEYACSPWCFDELELALDRRAAGGLRVVLLMVDETRVVPTRARALLGFTCTTRVELEARVCALIDLAKEKD